MKRILLLSFIAINFSTLAQAAEVPTSTLYSTITEADAKELNIQIPNSTSPGFKSIDVQITGMNQSTFTKSVLFCKDTYGVIHWDNICPDLTALITQKKLDASSTREELPPYNPLSNPKRTTDTAIIAFAALTLATGAGALSTKIGTSEENSATQTSSQQGYLAQLSKGTALVAGTQLGRGDKANAWQRPATQRVDGFFTHSAVVISGFSPLITRIVSDGNYLRSLFGPFAIALYPISLALGFVATRANHQEALPPSLLIIISMMALGVIDALAGLLAGLSFALAILFAGNITSLNEALTVAGVSLLAFSPAILASAFRPLRRAVWDFTSLWERITDYALASILTGWVGEQIVLGLPGLSGLQLPLTVRASTVGFWAAGLIIPRFAGEDISLKFFPNRLAKLQPQYRERSIFQQILATAFKVGIFATIAGKFIGISAELAIGVLLFALPLIMGIFEDRFPKSAAVQKWMPTGIIEMLAMTIVGYFLARVVQNRYPSARTYVLLSFVILSIPGLILKLLTLFGKDGAKDWRVTKYGVKAYRILGVVVLGALIYIIFSGLLLSNNV